jgi:hypothetical protein
VGFLDRAKKLRDQAKEAADQVKKLTDQLQQAAEDKLGGQATPPSGTGDTAAYTSPASGGYSGGAGGAGAAGAGAASKGPVEFGTPYVPGMLGRPGWRERGLTDPAALLPIRDRDRAGVPHTVKSQILEEPFGMGRRWTSGARSAALFYQLYPEHQAWQPPGGRAPLTGVAGASMAALPDGRTLVFLSGKGQSVVLEVNGLDQGTQLDLARTVAEELASA